MKKSFVKNLMAGLLCAACVLTACGKKTVNIPYTDLGIDATLEEILELEGDDYETYDSIYEGTTYTYEKEYKGRIGRIKYMLDADDALMNVAWTYTAASGEEADVVYKEIYADIQKDYGDPTDNSGVNNYGAVWKREEGNIILSAVISSDANIVQIAFLNPAVSRDEEGKLAGSGDASESDAEDETADDDPYADVTIENIREANSYDTLLKNHKQVSYEALQYANEDVDNGYLGYDYTVIKTENDSFSYLSSAASQSVPFTVVIEKNENGDYVQKTQFAGESIVETVYESEDDMKQDLKRLWYFDSDDFADEKITDIGTQDGALAVTTERTPDGGEYASDTITRYYFLNPDNLEIYAIDERMPTESDYGMVMTITSVCYDEDPDFTIEFSEEPDESVTDEDYANMGNAEDGEE